VWWFEQEWEGEGEREGGGCGAGAAEEGESVGYVDTSFFSHTWWMLIWGVVGTFCLLGIADRLSNGICVQEVLTFVSSWIVGSSLSKSEHTVIDLGHGGAPRLVSLFPWVVSV
jgi:hypothetical protein